MKRKLLVITLGCLFATIGCQKEDALTQAGQETANVKQLNVGQEEFDYFEQMAVDGNVDVISNIATDEYELIINGAQDAYAIEVIEYDLEGTIEVDITYQSTAYNVVLDMSTETIEIETVDDYTFDEYEAVFELDMTNSELENVMAIMIIHHGLAPNTSINIPGSGTGGPGYRRFMGAESREGPCVGVTKPVTTDIYVFWLKVQSTTDYVPC